MTATAEDELLALKRGLAKARERAARNGLTLELGDNDAGPSWPGHRYASAHLMEGRNQVASAVQSYRASDGKEAALSICLERVFSVPNKVQEAPNGKPHVTRPDRAEVRSPSRARAG